MKLRNFQKNNLLKIILGKLENLNSFIEKIEFIVKQFFLKKILKIDSFIGEFI